MMELGVIIVSMAAVCLSLTVGILLIIREEKDWEKELSEKSLKKFQLQKKFVLMSLTLLFILILITIILTERFFTHLTM